MIKYLGSKRRLVPALAAVAEAVDARTALDCFTGTTRVAQAFKHLGVHVTAVDRARAAHVLAQCYVATDADTLDHAALASEIERLNALPGEDGYVTATFCEAARYFQPVNGQRIDAIRRAIAADHAGGPLEPVLLTSLLEAADRVDSTVGVQMAYLKSWAPRANAPLALRIPELIGGPGRAVRGDTENLVGGLGSFDLAYIDPPYNQHRYEANYHVWETIVEADEPQHYGVACKRADLREPGATSAFNRRRAMPEALAAVVRDVDAELVVLSYNDEAWLTIDELVELCAPRGAVEVLEFPSTRYVGARIGIHNPKGERVGTVGRVRNVEYVLLAGPAAVVSRAVATHIAEIGRAPA